MPAFPLASSKAVGPRSHVLPQRLAGVLLLLSSARKGARHLSQTLGTNYLIPTRPQMSISLERGGRIVVFPSICDSVPHPTSSSHVHVMQHGPDMQPRLGSHVFRGGEVESWRKHRQAWRAQVVKSGLPHPELSLVFHRVTCVGHQKL